MSDAGTAPAKMAEHIDLLAKVNSATTLLHLAQSWRFMNEPDAAGRAYLNAAEAIEDLLACIHGNDSCPADEKEILLAKVQHLQNLLEQLPGPV